MSESKMEEKLLELGHLVPLDLLEPDPANSRARLEGPAMDELVASVKRDGVLQPILSAADAAGISNEAIAKLRKDLEAAAQKKTEAPSPPAKGKPRGKK